MKGLLFEEQRPVVAADPNRADIACFVGFVAKRKGVLLPTYVREWMHEYGWTQAQLRREEFDPEQLDDIPVPIDSWELFDRLFLWDQRIDGSSSVTYLGAAVRSFFSQGGRKCYVVRVGNPWPRNAVRADRLRHVSALIPGWDSGHVACTPVDRTSWHGVGTLFGLTDVSYLCVPDLAEAFAVDPDPVTVPELPKAREQFVECGTEPADPIAGQLVRWLKAPRCDEGAGLEWANAVRVLGAMLKDLQREVQLVVALPLPKAGTELERDYHGWLSEATNRMLDQQLDNGGISSAFVQLAFPWARTAGSASLPEQLESPDGVLAGVLARNALLRGSFRSAAGLPLVEVSEIWPAWSAQQLERSPKRAGNGGTRRRSMEERVSILGHTTRGFALLSDVTTSLDEGYRPACVNRLVTAIVRAARRAGEELTFESSGEVLWIRIREQMQRLLDGLFRDGALSGATPAEAFHVRCDRSTMTQNDLDAGRVIVSVQFQAAMPIEWITVVLGLHEGGQVTVLSPENGEAVQP